MFEQSLQAYKWFDVANTSKWHRYSVNVFSLFSSIVSLKFIPYFEGISLLQLIRLLNRTRDIVKDIKENSEYDPGFIENGGIFIARNQVFPVWAEKSYPIELR